MGLWTRLRFLLSLSWGVKSRSTRATFRQRVSVLFQQYNSILFSETFPAEDEIDTEPFQLGFFVFNPGDLYSLG